MHLYANSCCMMNVAVMRMGFLIFRNDSALLAERVQGSRAFDRLRLRQVQASTGSGCKRSDSLRSSRYGGMAIEQSGLTQSGPESQSTPRRRVQLPTSGSLRAFFQPVRARRTELGASTVVSGQIWLARSPLRPAAMWTALAGILSAGKFLLPLPLSWPEIVLLILLVDLLWGAIWRLAAGRAEVLPLPQRDTARTVALPYLTADSPAAHLLGDNTAEMWPVLFRIALPAALVALLTATALGVEAVGLTVLLLIVTTFGWISTRRAHQMPILLQSVVSIGLPWLLGALLSGVLPGTPHWGPLIGVVALQVLREWGLGRLQFSPADRLGLMVAASADIALGLLLIWLQVPLWLGLWFVASLPVWLTLLQQRPVARTAAWRLASILISAVAVGQSILT